MKKLFIVIEGYNDIAPKNANSIVAERIIKELSKKNLSISIITSIIEDKNNYKVLKDEGKYGEVYYIEADNMDEWRSRAISYFDKDFWDHNSNSSILSFSNPIQVSLFSVFVSKKYNINFFQYYLDPHSMSQAVRKKILYFPLRYLRDYKVHKYAKKVYVTHELYKYRLYTTFFKKFESKIIPLGLPFPNEFINNTHAESKQNKEVNISYFGRFYKTIRHPRAVIDFFANMDDNIILNIYGKSKEEYFHEFNFDISDEIDNVCFKGYVSRKQVNNAIVKSDFLVNIGNSVTNQLPSKVLEYASSGKPIINFYNNKNDTSKRFLEKYPLVFNVNLNIDLQSQMKELKIFMIDSLKMNVLFDSEKIYSELSSTRLSNIIYENL